MKGKRKLRPGILKLNNFSSKSTSHRYMPFVLKDSLSIKGEKFSRHVDLFVHLFARDFTSEVPTRKYENVNTLSQFSHLVLQGFAFYLSCIYILGHK